jgi:hypothetical protein
MRMREGDAVLEVEDAWSRKARKERESERERERDVFLFIKIMYWVATPKDGALK